MGVTDRVVLETWVIELLGLFFIFCQIFLSLYLQRCLSEIFRAKQMVFKNVIRTYWVMQKSKKSYHVPLERAGAAQAKKTAEFGQNGLSVPAAIS